MFLFHVQWKLTFFFGKTVRPQNELLIFLGKDTFRNKILEIVEDFACESIFSFFFLFSSFFLFFSFFPFFHFSHFFHLFHFFFF